MYVAAPIVDVPITTLSTTEEFLRNFLILSSRFCSHVFSLLGLGLRQPANLISVCLK